MTGGGDLHFDPQAWADADAHNPAVPPIAPSPVAAGGSAIDQLLAALGIASNSGIPEDNFEAQAEQAEREAGITDAQANFPANEQETAQLLQALPQALSALAGGLGGALGAGLQPFGQLAQAGAQGAQQALQTGLGAAQQAGGDTAAELDDFDDYPGGFDDAPGFFDDAAGSARPRLISSTRYCS